MYTAIHTFGRDLKRNIHIHLSVTRGGLMIDNPSKWIKDVFFSIEYLDHYTNTKNIKTLPAEEFIIRLITHIHNTGFRCIRYYAFWLIVCAENCYLSFTNF